MKTLHILSSIVLTAVSVVTVGCGGGTTSGGSKGSPSYLVINTNAAEGSSTSYEAWPNATITGYADPNTVALYCSPASDTNCVADIGNPSPYALTQNGANPFNTGSNGEADFFSDAISADWYFYAKDNGSSVCNGGTASTQTVAGHSSGSNVTLTCWQNLSEMIATPSSCNRYTNGTTDCPTTVTLSFPPTDSTSTSLPTATALAAVNYNSTGDNVAQNSVTASTTTSVAVPTPTTTGNTYLAVTDPTTGQVIGVAEFTVYVSTPSGGGTKTPPGGGGCKSGTHCTQ
jgi:hypothetical protein